MFAKWRWKYKKRQGYNPPPKKVEIPKVPLPPQPPSGGSNVQEHVPTVIVIVVKEGKDEKTE